MNIIGYPKYTPYFIMVQSSTRRTLPNMPSINMVANVCCRWLAATTASRSACSQRIPMKPGWHLKRQKTNQGILRKHKNVHQN